MDERWLLDGELAEDDVSCFDVIAVVCFELTVVALFVLDDGATVTVTVDFGPLLHSGAPRSTRGAAAASPSRQERKIFECILSKRSRLCKKV